MAMKDPRIDAMIKDAAPFAKPILKHLRAIVHRNCPKAEETLKWGMPTFLYEGKILCGMAEFKAHCTFWFWNGDRVVKKSEKADEAMGQFGRITSVKDLPSATVLGAYVEKAMRLKEAAAAKSVAKKPGKVTRSDGVSAKSGSETPKTRRSRTRP